MRSASSTVLYRTLNWFSASARPFPSADKVEAWLSNFRSGVKVMGSFVGKECSPIFAQRVFRTYRVLHFHSKLWSHQLRPLRRKGLFSLLLVTLCEPKKIGERIMMSELEEHKEDLNFIHELTAATVVCPNCKDRLVVDKKVPNVKYCHCPGSTSAYDRKVKGYAWTPFVETPDLLVWRMVHPERPGLFMYKVYGYYDDISAENFLNTQLDVAYRRKWDETALKLDVIENDKDINQDILYWEMKWPTMFSNRDYVFARRYLIDKETNTIVIISKSVNHPSAPEVRGIHRVKEYWSVMHVKAVTELSKPGVEFGLTYFDNPGVSLPQWLQNWASMTAIPEFLDKQRNAARKKARGKFPYFSSYSESSDGHAKIKPSAGDYIKPNRTDPRIINTNEESLKYGHRDRNQDHGTDGTATKPSDLKLLSQFFKENILRNAQ